MENNFENGIQNEKKDPNEKIEPDKQSLRQYWLFFSGQMMSLLGSSVVQFAIIWWLTVTSKSDPRYADQTGLILSLASVAGFAPMVITSLFSGVMVDRWNRKTVIVSADFMQAVFTGALMIIFYLDLVSIPLVLLILALRAVSQGFHNPAVQAIIPIMVPRDKLTRVNSFQYLFNGIIFLIGPVVGAVLIETLGVDQMGNILWVDVITFLVAIIPVIIIHIPDITREKRESTESSFKSEFIEGISFIKNTKGLLSLLITFTVINIMTAPVFVLLPIVVIDPQLLNGTAQTLALIMVFSQTGSIGASLVLTKWQIFKKNVNGVVLGQTILYLSVFIMAVSAFLGNIYGMLIASLFNGISLPFANIHSQTIWQSVVPPELQGRVMSVRQVIAWIMIPVAQLVGGILSDFIGPVNVFVGGATLGTMFLIYAWFMTGLPKVESTLGLDETVLDETIPPHPTST